MPTTKGLARTVAKYQARVAVASGDYKTGVTSPSRSWSAAASAAAPAWAQGTQEAISRGAFASGVTKAGDPKWSRGAAGPGADRYSQGVTFGLPNYQAGMQAVISTIESTSLSPSGAKGSAQNYERSKEIGQNLHAMKIAAKG